VRQKRPSRKNNNATSRLPGTNQRPLTYAGERFGRAGQQRNVGMKLLEFMGVGILVEIQRWPQWKQNLETIRERMACREERRW